MIGERIEGLIYETTKQLLDISKNGKKSIPTETSLVEDSVKLYKGDNE